MSNKLRWLNGANLHESARRFFFCFVADRYNCRLSSVENVIVFLFGVMAEHVCATDAECLRGGDP